MKSFATLSALVLAAAGPAVANALAGERRSDWSRHHAKLAARTTSGATASGFVGCFVDSATRQLGYSPYSSSSNTPGMCQTACTAAGYKYSGSEYGSECYCGNTLGAQASATDCNVACAGDATQMCGGSWRLSVYAATSAASSTTAPQTTTKSSSTVPVASPTSTASISKRGLGFNYVSATTPFANTVDWAYNWDSSYSGNLPAGVEYVPMLWSTSSDHTSQWTAHANAAIAAGSTHLLGFNEPDLSSQSNLSPQAAAAAWMQYMQPFAGKVKLVSPAITNGAPPAMGTGWLDSFLEACTGCTIDAIAIHIYDSASNAAYFKSYISGIGTKYGKPVWVTEFGASGTVAQQQTFLQTMIPYLDGLASVQKFAYFGDFNGTFVQNGQLLPLGQTYATA